MRRAATPARWHGVRPTLSRPSISCPADASARISVAVPKTAAACIGEPNTETSCCAETSSTLREVLLSPFCPTELQTPNASPSPIEVHMAPVVAERCAEECMSYCARACVYAWTNILHACCHIRGWRTSLLTATPFCIARQTTATTSDTHSCQKLSVGQPTLRKDKTRKTELTPIFCMHACAPTVSDMELPMV